MTEGEEQRPGGADGSGPENGREGKNGGYALMLAGLVLAWRFAWDLLRKSKLLGIGAEPERGVDSGVATRPEGVAGAKVLSTPEQTQESYAQRVAETQRERVLERAEVSEKPEVGAEALEQSRSEERPDAAGAQVREPGRTGRAEDWLERDGAQTEGRQKLGTLLVACCFLIALAGGVGFVVLYWTIQSNLLMGVALALFLGGLGTAMVLWAHWLMPHKQAIEPREELPSKPVEREAVVEAYCSGVHEVQRRGVLKWMGAAVVGVFAAMVVSVMRSLGASPDESLYTTVWKHGQRLMTAGGKPMNVASLKPGDSITVFPEDSIGSEQTQTVLVRVKEQLLQLPDGRANWAPQGYVAYSRVCTHAGCPVGLFEAESNLLLCPCHQSTFDVLRGALPTGGPAARPLPQLPLYADSEGNLRAGGGFTEPPGPGFWGMP